MMNGIVTRDVVGPALVIGTYDTCVVTVNDYAEIVKAAVYEDKDSIF